jgi:hypothetical protein
MIDRTPMPVAGCFSRFRAPSLRATDYRWVRSLEIYQDHIREHGRVSSLSRREIWHDDPVIAQLIRARVITSGCTQQATEDMARPADYPALTAIDLCCDTKNASFLHKMRCLLIGGADDVLIADTLKFEDPRIIEIAHAAFFDVRSRLKSPVLITSLVFPTCFVQGGNSNPMDTAMVLAWALGYDVFIKFDTCQPLSLDESSVYDAFIAVMRKNQEIASVLRRNLGFDAIETIAANLDEQVLLRLKAATANKPSETEDRLTKALSHLSATAGGPRVADDDVQPTNRVEQPTFLRRLTPATPAQKELQHAPA